MGGLSFDGAGGSNIADAFRRNRATQPTKTLPWISQPKQQPLPMLSSLAPAPRPQPQQVAEPQWSPVKNYWASGDYSMTDALRDRGLTRENGYEFMADPRTGASLYRKVPTQPVAPVQQPVYQPSRASRLAMAMNAPYMNGGR